MSFWRWLYRLYCLLFPVERPEGEVLGQVRKE